MDREELIKEHNEMVAKLLTEIKYLYLQRDNINNTIIEKFYNTTMNILNFYLKQPEWKAEYKENKNELAR